MVDKVNAFPRAIYAAKAGLLTHRSSRTGILPIPKNSGLLPSARCSQWRDRAGFAPASLFTHRLSLTLNGEHLGTGPWFHIVWIAVNGVGASGFDAGSR